MKAFLPLADRSFIPVHKTGFSDAFLIKVEAKEGKKRKGGDRGGMEKKLLVVSLNSFSHRRRRL
jgi:hypothetical protein